MTTPTGSPAWVRSNDFSTYGGATNKANYQSQSVVNPRTDVGAEGFSRLVSDVAAVARTAELGTLQVLCNDSGPGAPTIENCRLMTGVTAVGYVGSAPPGGTILSLPVSFPLASRNGNGDVTITFPASLTDEYGVTAAVLLKDPIACFVGAGGGVAVPELVSATVVRVRVFNLSAAAVSNARFTLSVGSGS